VIDAGLGGTLAFSDDEEGRHAYQAVQRVIEEGGSIELSSGISAKLAQVPVGLRGLLPEEEMTGTFSISAEGEPSPRPLPTFPLLVRAGAAELGLVLSYVEPLEGWNVSLVGSAGGLQLFMSLRGTGEEDRERKMDWRWKLGEGTALEQLLAAEVMLAAYNGAVVKLITPGDSKVVAELKMDRREEGAEELPEIGGIRDFLAYAAEAEAWLGVSLSPPAQPTDVDARILSWLVSQIRTPKRDGTFTRLEFVLSRPIAGLEEPFQIAATRALRGPLFGEERYLGTELIHVPNARFDRAMSDEQPGDTVAIVPVDGEDKITIHFYSPTEVPEDAARPPAAPG
jgi:hypothetical protein